jgi:WXG100 family type VII secretion target
MPDISVTYEAMESAASKLASAREEITSQLSELKSMVDELVQSAFRTQSASQEFEEAYTEFNTGVSHTIEGLDVMSKFLTSFVRAMEDVDRGSTISVQ